MPRDNCKLPYSVERQLQHVNLPERTILTGDFHSHQLWCNCKAKCNIPQRKLITLLEQNDFDILNEEDTSTYYYNNGSSATNLSFTMAVVTPLIRNWAIDEDDATSAEHEVIHFDITSDSKEHILPLTNEKWNWKMADWEGFSKHLKETTKISKDVWMILHWQCNLRIQGASATYLTRLMLEAAEFYVHRTRQ
jgi:hypothetical protein